MEKQEGLTFWKLRGERQKDEGAIFCVQCRGEQ